MKHASVAHSVLLSAAMACLASAARADLLTNGGFESGLTGWTTANQIGSNGSFLTQTGIQSPVNAFPVAAPPSGVRAAMTDAVAGGAHALYQDFVVPLGPIPQANITFSLYLNNAAGSYFNPATLDWAATNGAGGLNLNQQARVDIITTSANVFSVAAVDVLQNLFQTTTATPPVSGYNAFNIDITTLLLAHQGETLRLRFAETDNVNFFNFGVDSATINVPAPSVFTLGLLTPVVFARRSRRS